MMMLVAALLAVSATTQADESKYQVQIRLKGLGKATSAAPVNWDTQTFQCTAQSSLGVLDGFCDQGVFSGSLGRTPANGICRQREVEVLYGRDILTGTCQ